MIHEIYYYIQSYNHIAGHQTLNNFGNLVKHNFCPLNLNKKNGVVTLAKMAAPMSLC